MDTETTPNISKGAERKLLPSALGDGRRPTSLTVGLAVSDSSFMAELTESLQQVGIEPVFRAQPQLDGLVAQCGVYRPDVLLLGDQPEIEETIGAVRRSLPACTILLATRSAQADSVLRAWRAGVFDIVHPPVRASLPVVLMRLEARRQAAPQPSSSGQMIGVLSAKGGAGATTVACHVANSLSVIGIKRALLADFDLCGGNVAFLMKAAADYTVLDALANLRRLDVSLWNGLITSRKGLDVLAAPRVGKFTGKYDPGALRQLLRFMRVQYDCTILDLGSGFGALAADVAPELDELLLVCTLEAPALWCAMRLSDCLEKIGPPSSRIRLVLNAVPERSAVGGSTLGDGLQRPVYAELPNFAEALHEQWLEGTLLAPGSREGRSFVRLAARLTGTELARGPARRKWLAATSSAVARALRWRRAELAPASREEPIPAAPVLNGALVLDDHAHRLHDQQGRWDASVDAASLPC